MIATFLRCASLMSVGGLMLSCTTAGPESPPSSVSQFSVFSSEQACSVNDDCILMPAGCCGCNMGGQNTGINKNSFKTAHARRQSTCKNIFCIQIISNHPSCMATGASCVDGACIPK